jgi:hypothetical protein
MSEDAGRRRLATNVEVDGTWYGPGDEIPDEIAAKIRNPKVWAVDDVEQRRSQVEDGPAGASGGTRLTANVEVDGRWYGPGDHIPDDVAAKIRNPKVWEGGRLPAATSSAPAGGNLAGASGNGAGGAVDDAAGEGRSAGPEPGRDLSGARRRRNDT